MQARASRPQQEAWASQGGGHGGEHRGCHSDNPLQGPTIVPSQSAHQVSRVPVLLKLHPQLDSGLCLHPRPLPLMVRMDGSSGSNLAHWMDHGACLNFACIFNVWCIDLSECFLSAGASAEEVPSQALGSFTDLHLWAPPVPGHCSLH